MVEKPVRYHICFMAAWFRNQASACGIRASQLSSEKSASSRLWVTSSCRLKALRSVFRVASARETRRRKQTENIALLINFAAAGDARGSR